MLYDLDSDIFGELGDMACYPISPGRNTLPHGDNVAREKLAISGS
ncbi:hypothetical protein XCR_4177 [Xanthomonas campestris pv. raphani 756C]|nr:hypothetical protein XCR_4177 [Xanthomonas campestris pv. raphani 756C]